MLVRGLIVILNNLRNPRKKRGPLIQQRGDKMPYIAKKNRPPIDRHLDRLIEVLKNSTDSGKRRNGEVVYAVYKILKYVYGQGHFEEKSNALKVLDSAGKEYYHRIMAPYEDKKIVENGEV